MLVISAINPGFPVALNTFYAKKLEILRPCPKLHRRVPRGPIPEFRLGGITFFEDKNVYPLVN
jgi:hypothetical protein